MSLLNGVTSIPILLEALYRDQSISLNTRGQGFTEGPEGAFTVGQASAVNATYTPIDLSLGQYMITWLENYARSFE
jgi:hypothetical protein